MKYIIFMQILALFLLSCSTTSSIKVYKDDFHNATIITLEQRLDAQERPGLLLSPYNMTITYMRTSAIRQAHFDRLSAAQDIASLGASLEAGKEKLQAFVRIDGLLAKDGMLNSEGALKVDGNTYSLKFESRYSGIDRVYTYYNPGSRFVYASASRTGSGGFAISDEAREKLKGCKALALRFYVVDKVMTFVFQKEELIKLKEFLAFYESKNTVDIKRINIK